MVTGSLDPWGFWRISSNIVEENYRKAGNVYGGNLATATEILVADALSNIGKLWNKTSLKGGSKTIDDIIDSLPETNNRKGIARNFESTGGFKQAIKDFNSLNPMDVKGIQTQYGPGKVGKLSDGTIVVRPGSKTGGATLEIKVSNSKVFKIRY